MRGQELDSRVCRLAQECNALSQRAYPLFKERKSWLRLQRCQYLLEQVRRQIAAQCLDSFVFGHGLWLRLLLAHVRFSCFSIQTAQCGTKRTAQHCSLSASVSNLAYAFLMSLSGPPGHAQCSTHLWHT